MALIKLSGVIGDIRGSVGGSTFAQTASGLVLKNRANPVNKNTDRQSLLRSFTFSLQQKWLALTDQQRQNWKVWTDFNPIKQNNFTGLFINAQQTFIKLNLYRLLYNYPILENPVFNKTLISPITGNVTIISHFFVFLPSRIMRPDREFIILSLTVRVPLTKNNPGTLFKLITFQTDYQNVFDLTIPYHDVFGRVPVVGDKLFLKFTTADLITGRVFPFQQKSVIL